MQSVIYRFALILISLAISLGAHASVERAVVEQFLSAGRVVPDPARLTKAFEEAYIAYFVRAKGGVTENDKALISKASALLNPKALHTSLVDLYVEELSPEEAALALDYYSIQPPDNIRHNREAVLRWAESLTDKQSETIERFRDSDVGRSLQAKILKVTLLLSLQTTARLTSSLVTPDKENDLRALSTECDKLYAEGDGFKILTACSIAASIPCANCEFNIGMVYMSGALFPRDARRALSHIRSAALLNNTQAQAYYGRFLVRQDYPPAGSVVEGIQWLMLSAKRGFQLAQQELNTERQEHPAEVKAAASGFDAFLKANAFTR